MLSFGVVGVVNDESGGVNGRIVGDGDGMMEGTESPGGCAEFITQQVEGELQGEGAVVFRIQPSSLLNIEVWFRTELKPLYFPVIQRLTCEVS